VCFNVAFLLTAFAHLGCSLLEEDREGIGRGVPVNWQSDATKQLDLDSGRKVVCLYRAISSADRERWGRAGERSYTRSGRALKYPGSPGPDDALSYHILPKLVRFALPLSNGTCPLSGCSWTRNRRWLHAEVLSCISCTGRGHHHRLFVQFWCRPPTCVGGELPLVTVK
jgi:hypothetical protein